MKKEYCIKAELNSEYILYIAKCFGGYGVFVTNHTHAHNYLVYGHYKNIGVAENRLLKSAKSYKSNPIKYTITSKKLFDEYGAF